MVRITSFSDTHGEHRSEKFTKWFFDNPSDILVFAGDLQGARTDKGLDFLRWVHELPYEKKIISFGNHDSSYAMVTHEAKNYKDVVVLNQSGARVMGVNFFGSPYSLTFCNWWFMGSEIELSDLYSKIPNSTQVLITHTPAYGILDAARNGYHCGSESLAARIKELPRLKYHVCGHIHEGYGRIKQGKLTYINSAVLDGEYHFSHLPQQFKC